MTKTYTGPLNGIRIIEMAGIGPGPFAGMMLADHGADVVRICRPSTRWEPEDVLLRSRRSIVLDMKLPQGLAVAMRLIAEADGLIEGYRPGVMERLGLGPEVFTGRNPKLIYGRMTGWGQTGPYARAAGHDINYIALAGTLHALGRAGDKPTPPINLVGDFGGGGMLLAFGMVSALLQARTTGRGQVIDCAMTDGAALLMSMTWGFREAGRWNDVRGTNFLDTGAHFYDTYQTADGAYISVGAIEPQFYRDLLERAGITDPDFAAQNDPARWPILRAKMAAVFAARTRAEWCEVLEATDACFAPVLSMPEAAQHPHNRERGTFVAVDGRTQPAPAPRFSATPEQLPRSVGKPGAESDELLREAGYRADEIIALREQAAVL